MLLTGICGNLVEHIAADGAVTRWDYDEKDQAILIIDPLGGEWKREYDEVGNVIAETDPLGHVTRYTYNEQGLPVMITDVKGGMKRFGWDGAGRIKSFQDCLGSERRWSYDERGRVVSEQDGVGSVTRYDYEGAYFATIEHPDGAVERFHHDAEGRRLEHVDPLGGHTRFEYGVSGRLLGQTDAAGRRVRFGWDKLDRLVRLTNENGETTHFRYDILGRKLEEDGPQRKVAWHYDPITGRLSGIERDGVLITVEQDASGRVTSRRGKGVEENFSYDVMGRLWAAEGTNARLRWDYDALGRTIEERQELRAGATRHFLWRHEYDELGNRLRTRRPDGRIEETGITGSSHVWRMALDGQELALFERDGEHREVERALGNGLRQSRKLDPRGRPIAQRIGREGVTPLIRRDYSYDAAGRLTNLTGPDGASTYRYDPTGRLLEAASPAGTEQFHYDAAGNFFRFEAQSDRQTDPTSPFYTPHVQGNLLSRYGKTRYQHERHNVVERIHKGETQRYQWDALDRMVSAETSTGTTRYYYDPLGRRIAKHRTDGSWQWFGWDGDRVALETTDNEGIHYFYDPNSFAPLAQVHTEAITSPLLGKDHWFGAELPEQHPKPPRSIHYYHTDHLGTPRELTDSEGNVALTMTYKAWGEGTQALMSTAEPGLTNPFRFQGQYHDPETGLYYNRHRYYDPALGRFLSHDPIGLLGGTNLYQYTPNPIGYIDPLGLDWMNGACATITVGGISKPPFRSGGGKHAEIRGLESFLQEIGSFSGKHVIISDVLGNYNPGGVKPAGICTKCRAEIFRILKQGGAKSVTIPYTVNHIRHDYIFIPASKFDTAYNEITAINNSSESVGDKSKAAWDVLLRVGRRISCQN